MAFTSSLYFSSHEFKLAKSDCVALTIFAFADAEENASAISFAEDSFSSNPLYVSSLERDFWVLSSTCFRRMSCSLRYLSLSSFDFFSRMLIVKAFSFSGAISLSFSLYASMRFSISFSSPSLMALSASLSRRNSPIWVYLSFSSSAVVSISCFSCWCFCQ